MQTKDYIVDEDGNFRFTEVGLESQTPLLAKAGIDACTIKTYAQYIQARKAASPYFIEYLQEETDKQLDGKPDTLGWQAIKSLAYSSVEEQEQLIEKLRKRKHLSVVTKPSDN